MRDNKLTLVKVFGESFTRRIIVPMASMIIVAIVLVLGFVVVSAGGQNRIEIESSTKLAETALNVHKRHLARNLRDYAVWEDAYHNLHEELDFEWASTDGNVGANIYEGLGYEMAFVMAPGGQSVYAVINGVPQVSDAYAFLPNGLKELVVAGLAEEAPAVGLLRSGDKILLVAATAILPSSVAGETVSVDERSTLIFAKALNDEFLARIGNEYLLKQLHIVPQGSTVEGASIPLLSPDGSSLGRLAWSPETPGYELLRLLLPPLALALVVLAAFAWLVVNNARKSAAALEQSAHTVEAYAQTLQESEARFRDVAEASSDWIWECDPDLRLVYLSARFSEATGTAAANVLGKTLSQFFTIEPAFGSWGSMLALADEPSIFRDVKCSFRDAGGSTRICRIAGRPIIDFAGGVTGYRGTATDITDEVEAQARANHLALHDALTQLPNRVLFRDRLQVELLGNRSEKPNLAMLCLDLDHFKEVNDTLGHSAGDCLLKQVSERLQACVRRGDTVARLGGDEFAIVQTSGDQPASAEQLSDRILGVLKEPFNIDGHSVHIGVSIGIAIPDKHDDDPEKLLKNADIALYRAKNAGRGTCCFFEARMDEELQARKALENDLRLAVPRSELEVHYQPLLDLGTDEVAAVEALMRWRHPVQGLISPAEFIPIAEDTGLIIAMGEWVLRTACACARSWPGVRVAVNLSPVQFRHRELVETVQDILMETRLDPERLELEITESVLINDTEAALKVLTDLKRIGVNIAMDDFGTGYSSLAYLNAFPFDKIKIDRSFIADLRREDKSSAIVRSVLSLGTSLHMTTTAEGVETDEQMAFLRNEGCKQVQGYLFGRPMPPEEMTLFLTSRGGRKPRGRSGIAA
jgi:diguanylate cyclase (GGDEF)-like protein/PAS domain S-box-containing protein